MNILIVSDIRNISKMKVEKRIEMKKKQWTVVRVLFFIKIAMPITLMQMIGIAILILFCILSFGSVERHTYSTLSGV